MELLSQSPNPLVVSQSVDNQVGSTLSMEQDSKKVLSLIVPYERLTRFW